MNENMETLVAQEISNELTNLTLEPEEIVEETVNEPTEQWHNDALVSFAPIVEPEKSLVETEEPKVETTEDDFDVFFDSLSDDVEGASSIISDILEKKRTIKNNEENMTAEKEKLNNEKAEFERYKENQLENIDLEKKRLAECIRVQKNKISEEEAQIKADADVMHKELTLKEQSVRIEQRKLDTDKEQFNKYREVEESKIAHEKDKLVQEREQLEKDKELALQKLENDKRELEAKIEQFNKYKEVEEKKIALEKSNLSQRCERFKTIVAQFNNKFAQLPNED